MVRELRSIALTNLTSKGLRPGDEMTQQGKGLSMLESLSLIPRTHIEAENNQRHKVVP